MKHSSDCAVLAGPEDLLRNFLGECLGQCLGFLDTWLATHDRAAHARAMELLGRLLAGTEFLSAGRLRVFCHQWRELLLTPDKVETAGAGLQKLVLHAGIRIEQSLATGQGAREAVLLDAGSMNRLRAARGVAEYDMGYRLAEDASSASPRFIRALQQALDSALVASSETRSAGRGVLQAAGFWREYRHGLPNVAAPDLSAEQALLRLDFLCAALRRGDSEECTQKSVPDIFQWLSRQALLHGLVMRWRLCVADVATAFTEQKRADFQEARWMLAQTRVCLRYFADRTAWRMLDELCALTECLVFHLLCQPTVDPLGLKMLLMCFLSMERGVVNLLSGVSGRTRKLRSEKPVERKLRRYLRARHAAACEAGRAPGQDDLRRLGMSDMQMLIPRVRALLRQQRILPSSQSVPDELPALWSRLSVCALCLGQVALYEVLSSVHRLLLMAVERRLLLSTTYLRCLGGLLAGVLRSIATQAGVMPGVPALAAHQMAAVRVLAARREPDEGAVPRDEVGDCAAPESRNLPVYLAAHLNRLVVAPEALSRNAHSPVNFLAHSRACLLELNLLSQGARALSVLRVADLAEGLAEVHRAVQIEQVCPAADTVTLLCSAHQSLRTCLNHAAARQSVPDVRAVLFRLHTWLESAPPFAARSRGDNVLVLARTLTAGMRSLEDALVLMSADHRQGLPMLRRQLADQLSKCLQLEEELADAEQVCLGRWRPRLWRVAARCAGEIGLPVRMRLDNDALRIPRDLVEMLLPTLEIAVRWLLMSSCHAPGRREVCPGDGVLRLCVRPRLLREHLVLTLTCAGGFAPQPPCNALPDTLLQALALLGGSGVLKSGDERKSHIRLLLPACAPRWDIPGKPL